jgi:hypothetical protein
VTGARIGTHAHCRRDLDTDDGGVFPWSFVSDPSDLLFYLALVLLPVDGTVAGVSLPYWSPLSPWFFLAYAVANWRVFGRVFRRYAAFMLLPVLLALMSVYGWMTMGFHAAAAAKSIGSVVLGLACLASLEIALRIKRLDWRPMVTVLVAAYSFAFLVGVLQWASARWQINDVRVFFGRLMLRQYAVVRPQFLFAEPSYIGMHLYGVLLPVYWLARDRRVASLIPVFACGAVFMGAGTRIVIDTVVAGVLWVVADVNLRRRWTKTGVIGAAGGIALATTGVVIAVLRDPRLGRIASQGLLTGDGSMSARIVRSLAPAWSWMHDTGHALTGWGAGNISAAMRSGYDGAMRWYEGRGGLVTGEIRALANPTADVFTMSGYVSFITEFGIIGMAVLMALTIMEVARHGRWSRGIVCCLVLVAYLYTQFEAYAFYALPLVVWGVGRMGRMESGQRFETTPTVIREVLPANSSLYNQDRLGHDASIGRV